jgi:predicted membrane GTPase involved in stress response
MKMGETDSADKFMVFGRGVLHLSVLIETMRREGYMNYKLVNHKLLSKKLMVKM